jgi:predicted acyl esterase
MILVVLAFAGCVQTPPSTLEAAGRTFPVGVHPYPAPDGAVDENGLPLDPKAWPTDLAGPFKLKEVQELRIPSFDGTLLQLWVILPDLPQGVFAPTVLKASPYYGQNVHEFNGHTGDDPDYWDNSAPREAVPINLLISQGYAIVLEAVRGTGNSGGCFDFFGDEEQKDQAHVVEWIAEQPWSNGRVGMMGLSYHGTTPTEGAILNPPHLKTIVVSGMVTDLYDFLLQSPQGAGVAIGGPFGVVYTHWQSLSPPITAPTKGGPMYGVESWFVNGNMRERACPEAAELIEAWMTGLALPDRDRSVIEERRLIDRMPGITAAVFMAHGFQDGAGPYAHNNADRDAWGAMPDTPKRKLSGQYGHMFPNFAPEDMRIPDWNETLVEWLDFWLKGIGDAPPGEGTVDYQDTAGEWHHSTAWPPAETRNEVLYLTQGKLSATPGAGGTAFRAAPGASGLCFLSEPATEDMLIAGNPIAYLRLQSDLPGGRIEVSMHQVDAGGGCSDMGAIEGSENWLFGAADLLYHKGNYDAQPFPTGTPTPVRIDMSDQAFPITKGQRLGIQVNYPIDSVGYPIFPNLFLSADGGEQASHVVVPLITGTFGGSTPTIEYPPRPHIPDVADYDYRR